MTDLARRRAIDKTKAKTVVNENPEAVTERTTNQGMKVRETLFCHQDNSQPKKSLHDVIIYTHIKNEYWNRFPFLDKNVCFGNFQTNIKKNLIEINSNPIFCPISYIFVLKIGMWSIIQFAELGDKSSR